MITTKEQLLQITGLNLEEIVPTMEEEQFNLYLEKLNNFVKKYAEQEILINELKESKNYDLLPSILNNILDLLKEIHADEQAKNLQAEIDKLKNNIVIDLPMATSPLLTLTIDIQMALYSKNEDSTPEPIVPEVEQNEKTLIDILAVDDTAFFLQSLKSILHDAGYKVICVKCGQEALNVLNDFAPRILLLDIIMPEMDGYELARRIKEKGETAPIIFLTGNSKREYVLKAIEAGGIDFIVKPINRTDVLPRIKKYLG